MSELDVQITSSPELPEDEILSRFLFGRSLSQISPVQALQIAAAIRSLSGGDGTGVIDRLRNRGLVESRPDPEDRRADTLTNMDALRQRASTH